MSGSVDTAPAWRVALDVGGTFTDVVATNDCGRTVSFKLLSSPPAFDKAAADGVTEVLVRADVTPEAVGVVLHGTTAATNAVLERSGPPTALITTAGFRDVLEIGRLRTPRIYDLTWVKPRPLVPRNLRLEAVERIAASGAVISELEIDSVAAQVRAAVAAGVRTFAVSLINSYANDTHERAVAEWLQTEYPHLAITIGSRITREPGEYERTSTAVLNAYLKPVISEYLRRLSAGLADNGVRSPAFVLQSSGGMMAPDEAAEYPVHLLESGPAAGVLAAAAVARSAGTPTAVGFDMGGTTAKAALIERGRPAYAAEFSVGSDVSSASRLLRGGGYAVRLPVLDLAEVGAGGGSIAAVDEGGGLSVGPRSAGADPGPACYSRNGTRPTVTDANVVLGYLSLDGLARSGVMARRDLAEEAIAREIAEPLGLTVIEAAFAIHSIANQRMAQVLRAVTTERGRSIEDQVLIVSGGSGAIHAAGLADTVGISTVLVPPLAGLLSAVGLLGARPELTAVETVNVTLDMAAAPRVEDQLQRMADDLRRRLADGGLDADESRTERVLDVRYAGQATELPIQLPWAPLGQDDLARVAERFGAAHVETYGHGAHGAIEIVRARVTVALPTPLVTPAPAGALRTAAIRTAARAPQTRRCTSRNAVFGAPVTTPVIARTDLIERVEGPLLVDEPDTTVVVPPGWSAHVDATQNVVLERVA